MGRLPAVWAVDSLERIDVSVKADYIKDLSHYGLAGRAVFVSAPASFPTFSHSLHVERI
jgi:hypothetical protein